MIVMKFGGTSIADTESVQRVTEIIRQHLKKKPIVVNSAMGKTTRNLLNTAQLSAMGRFNQAEKNLEEIRQYHLNLIDDLLSGEWKQSAQSKIEDYFQELRKLLGGLSILRELSPSAQDKFLSYGELISTAIVSVSLNANRIKSDLMDARKLVITDENFTGANPIKTATYKKIKQAIQTKIKAGSVPVVQGFIGSTKKGLTTTLGFEGSDLTASLLGAALNTTDIQIWKDVSGIMTADPEIVPEAKTVKSISFDEVAELTYFGAKVFYARAVEPARQAGIPVHVYNSKKPDQTGTEIALKPKSCSNPIKSISYKSPVFLVNIEPAYGMMKTEFLNGVMKVLEQYRIDPKLLQHSKNNVTFVIENVNTIEPFLTKFNPFGNVTCKENKATVSMVGEGLRTQQDISGIIINILKTQPVDLISTGVSPINVTIVIDEKNLKEVIHKLHAYFFKTVDPSVFE